MSAQENATNHYSINETSKLTGLPASTLRYYESIGIIKPVTRDSSSKHRTYNQQDIDVLDTIACLNATGMKLDDMRTYIANLSDDVTPFDDQIALLKAQQERLMEEARYVQLRREYVELKIEYWEAVKSHDEARVQQIASRAKQLAQELKKS
jgi:DNA-binding transcriptional MerR regulator